MNAQKNFVVVLFTAFVLFSSCAESAKDRVHQDAIHQSLQFLMLPDSLRSEDEKKLFQQLEALLYEGCTVKNGKFEMTISKKEWKKRGVSEVYYDILKHEIVNINHWIDTVSYSYVRLFEESWQKSYEEYLERKKSEFYIYH
jgi:hypothetical protein